MVNAESGWGVFVKGWEEILKYRLSLSDMSLGVVSFFFLLLLYFQKLSKIFIVKLLFPWQWGNS